MAVTPWESYYTLTDENNGEEQTLLPKGGEALCGEIGGSMGEVAALLGLEEDIYGGLGRENAAFPPAMNANIEPSNAKKEEHNARERQRRMELSQLYFSLRSLLPNARRSKKRWSSTTIIDKVVDYIPTLQKEIENMKEKKQKMIKEKGKSNERVLVDEKEGLENDNLSVLVHQVCKGEVIIQICINQRNNMIKFSNLIQKAEEEGLRIIGASTVCVSPHHPTLTSHLHFQMDRSVEEGDDYKSILRKRVISWLC
ncbi:transcription factor bHLH160 [Cucurbita pepo subsp. pepo]|uniref:transcription factor bHLH160 n=1 Tax=Cucurbita pepo subsp. pepo TaxID=3664 RepID=UPI000C9D2AB9|nr:transcription factor bHLH160 [Cucurbita pepo subsp. pepo]